VARNSYSNSRASAAEGKTASAKNSAISDTFPALSEITREIEDEGFVHVGDAGWDWEDYRQFFRLFYKEEIRRRPHLPERTA
jgi:hypothetical protein